MLGVDPGFKNGCKCAIVSATGNNVLDTFVFTLNDQARATGMVNNLLSFFKCFLLFNVDFFSTVLFFGSCN